MANLVRFDGSAVARTVAMSALLLAPMMSSCSAEDPGTGPNGKNDAGGGGGADAVRGGALYDSWFAALKMTPPTSDNPLWATRPDMMTNTLKGADTWRCKECHGWDYKGVSGAYGSGSHKTGFAGILGTTKSEAEIITSLKDKHGYKMVGLSDAALADLAKFVKDTKNGAIDLSPIINADKTFKGNAAAGKVIYDGSTSCTLCHGPDGLNPQPVSSPGGFDEFPGKIASDNPWEFTHKVRYGMPGFEMPPQATELTVTQLGDLGAYSQTLPKMK